MLNVIIKDSNVVFSCGLKHYLEKEFLLYEVNILFLAVEPGFDCLLALSGIGREFNGIIFFIMDASIKPIANTCLTHFPVIYRSDSITTVRGKVVMQLELWQRAGCDGIVLSPCAVCGRTKLTKNEIKVLGLLANEFSLTKAAWVLGKNVKTVFTQKKSIMKKLNLQDSRELSDFIIKHRKTLVSL